MKYTLSPCLVSLWPWLRIRTKPSPILRGCDKALLPNCCDIAIHSFHYSFTRVETCGKMWGIVGPAQYRRTLSNLFFVSSVSIVHTYVKKVRTYVVGRCHVVLEISVVQSLCRLFLARSTEFLNLLVFFFFCEMLYNIDLFQMYSLFGVFRLHICTYAKKVSTYVCSLRMSCWYGNFCRSKFLWFISSLFYGIF